MAPIVSVRRIVVQTIAIAGSNLPATKGRPIYPKKIRRDARKSRHRCAEISADGESERILYVSDPNSRTFHDHPDDVEPVRLLRPAVAIDPDHRGTSQLPALPPVDGFNRAAEALVTAGFDLDEGDRAVALDYEVDIPVPIAEASLQYAPPVSPEPTLGDSFSDFAKGLRGR
jgi:hypothetical protein